MTLDPRISATLDHLRSRWSDADTAALRFLFPLLATGRPVTPSAFARAAGLPLARALDVLSCHRLGTDSAGHITELFGFSLSPTLHRLELNSVAIYSCCAVVAHVVPIVLAKPAAIESVDPVSRRVVRITLSPMDIAEVHPETATSTFVLTDAESLAAGASSAFCSHVRHFDSSETAHQFAALDSRRYVLPLLELHSAAHAIASEIWP